MRLRSAAWFILGEALRVNVNGEPRELTEHISLADLVNLLQLPHERIAIELNHAVVRRGDWLSTELHEGDKVEVVHFVGGGSFQLIVSPPYLSNAAS